MKFIRRLSIKNWLVILACVAGMWVSLYLWQLDSKIQSNETVPTTCDINEIFSCSTVAQSKYAYIGGVPVAAIGLFGYIALLFLYLAYLYRNKKILIDIFLGLTLSAFAFSLYLTYIEAFVIHAYCPYCIASAVCITIITILGAYEWKQRRHKSSNS